MHVAWWVLLFLMAGCTSQEPIHDAGTEAKDDAGVPAGPAPEPVETPEVPPDEAPAPMRVVRSNGTAVNECDIVVAYAHSHGPCPNGVIDADYEAAEFLVPVGTQAMLIEWLGTSGGKMSTTLGTDTDSSSHGAAHNTNFEGYYSWMATMEELEETSEIRVGIEPWNEAEASGSKAGMLMDGKADVAVAFFVDGVPDDGHSYCSLC